MSRPHPPRLATLLLRLTADPRRRDAQLGDLEEEHAELAQTDAGAAGRWYWRQVAASVPHNLRSRARARRNHRRMGTGDGMMKTLLQDLKVTARGIRNELAFTAVVVATLALGIGATTTIFSVVHGLILDPFPFPEPERIVGVGTAYPRMGADLGFIENMSPAEFVDVRDGSRTLEDVVAWDMGNRQIDTDGPPENVFSAFWWGDALGTVGMEPVLGRGFAEDEIATGANAVMISEGLWISRFGADSSMVGGPLSVNGNPYTLVGIFPEGMDVYGTDLWMVMPVGPEVYPRNRRQFQLMARIRDGFTLRDVNNELATIAARVEQDHAAEFDEYEGWALRALTWNDVASNVFRTGAFVLMGAVTFVLLLVCANTANLLLARAQTRRREMAVRTALGARRGRLVTQLLTESVFLSLLGGALGVVLARLGVRGVNGFLGTVGFGIAGTVELSAPVLWFTGAVAASVGVVFGLAPALHASGSGVAAALQAEGRAATAGRNRQRLQRTLVGIQVALAFVLLAGAGLLVNSFVRMTTADPGFEPEGVLTMRLTLPREEYRGQEGPAFFRELVDRLGTLRGVRAAGAGTQFPSVAFSYRQVFFDGPEADPEATLPTVLATAVTRGYFEALGIPLRRGRTFDERDAEDTPPVVVLNEEAARRYLPGQDPIGRRVKLGAADAEAPWWEVVGVVGSTRNRSLGSEPFPEVFALHEQVGGTQNQLFLLLRADGDPRALVPAVRQVVLDMDPDQPVYAIRTAPEALLATVAPQRAATLLLSIFGVFALVIAAVGVYAVVSYGVSERTQEIGLRVALGADRGRVLGLVVRQALLPVAVGAAVGFGGAYALGGALQSMLFRVGGRDPMTLGAIAVLLLGVAAAASWIPAWRASRLDPVEALRVE